MSILQPFNSDGGFNTSANIVAGNISTSGSGGNITGANVVSAVTVTASGNITGANVVATTLYGDGGNITGITVSGGNEILNGTSNVIIPTANGNINFNTADGLGNIWSWVMDVNGNLTVPANVPSTITTPVGSNGNITIHPDGSGQLIIQGATANLLTLQSDTANTQNRLLIQTFGNALGQNGGGVFQGAYLRPNTPLVQNDRLVSLGGRGSYDGVSYNVSTSGSIGIYASDVWSSTSTPTRISFFNTTANTTNTIENMRLDNTGNLHVYNGNLLSQGAYITGLDGTGINAIYAGVTNYTPITSNVIAQFAGNVNSYAQINFQNINTGTQSSTDIIVTADNGGDTTHYFDMGIAGGNWDGTQPNSLGTAISAGDGYLWNQDGNVKIATTVGTAAPFVWGFDTVGNLTLPGNTFSVNYANGTPVTLGGGNTGNFAFGSYTLDSTAFDEISLTGTNSGNILISADGLAMLAANYESDGIVAGNGNAYIFTGDPTFVDGIPQPGYVGGPPGRVLQFNNDGNVILPAQNVNAAAGESVHFYGTRKIVNGVTNSYAYSTVLSAGGTPTVAYTATDSTVQSVRVTFAVQGSANVWEQFDVVVVQTLPQGNVNFTVSNRVKASDTPDTVVTATWNGTAIEISLNLDASQTGGGWASFDAVEFGLMAG